MVGTHIRMEPPGDVHISSGEPTVGLAPGIAMGYYDWGPPPS